MNKEAFLKVADEIEQDENFRSDSYFNVENNLKGCAIARIGLAHGGELQLDNVFLGGWFYKYEDCIGISDHFCQIVGQNIDDILDFIFWSMNAKKEDIVKALRLIVEDKWDFKQDPEIHFERAQQ